MRAIRLLNRRRLRRQPLRAILAVAAIGAGASLAVCVLIVSASMRHSYAHFGSSVGGPDALRVIGAGPRGGLDASVADEVAATPGVAAAVPVVQTVTLSGTWDGIPMLVLGIDCRAEALVGKFGCMPDAVARANVNTPPLVGPGLLRPDGHRITMLRTDLGPRDITGATVVPALKRLNGGAVAVYPLPVAQQLFARHGTVDAIYVKPAPGVDPVALRQRLNAVVGEWNAVVPAAQPPVGAAAASSSFVIMFGLLSLFALGIGAVLVRNTVALSLEERRRHLGVVAALGAGPRTVAGAVLVEAGVLGLVGGAFGVAGGLVLARPITASLAQFGSRLSAIQVAVYVPASVVAIGVLLGLIVALVSAWRPARRALRLDVAAEISSREARQEASSRNYVRRAAVWLGIGLAGVLACWLGSRNGSMQPWQPVSAQAGVLIAILGLTMTTGALAPVVVRALGPLVARLPAASRLGVGNLERDAARTGVMTVAVAASVGIAFVIASFGVSVREGISHGIAEASAGRVRVSNIDGNNTVNVDAKLSPATVDAIEHLPGVTHVDHTADLMIGHSDKDLIGVIGTDQQTVPFAIFAGKYDVAAFNRGEVLIGAGLARRKHLRAGSTLRIPGVRGMADVKVMAVYANGDFNGSTVVMPLDMMTRIYGPQPLDSVFLHLDPASPAHAEPWRLIAGVQQTKDPFLFAQTPEGVARSISRVLGASMKPFWVLQRGLMLVAFIAVASTLLLVVLQRRRELGMMASIGATPGQLATLLLAEAATVGVVGSALGALAGVGMFEAMRDTMPVFIGYLEPFRLDLGSVAIYGPLTILAVLAAAAWPALRLRRIDIVSALQYE